MPIEQPISTAGLRVLVERVTPQIFRWPWHVNPWPGNDQRKDIAGSREILLTLLADFRRANPAASRLYIELCRPGEAGGIEGWNRADRWQLFSDVPNTRNCLGSFYFTESDGTASGIITGALWVIFLDPELVDDYNRTDELRICDLYLIERISRGLSHEDAVQRVLRCTRYSEDMLEPIAGALAQAAASVPIC